MTDNEKTILVAEPSRDYELLDSGAGEKLERFGKVILRRPDPQAIWEKRLSDERWLSADAVFKKAGQGGKWINKKGILDKWPISIGGLNFYLKLGSFKHTGVFPEHAPNWSFISEKTSQAVKENGKASVLNLFGYTGGATLAAAKAGAEVTHLDGSRVAIGLAKENAAASSLSDKPIRWILDDARAFVRRELKRGKTYDGIIMDPPTFGRGPKGETWNIEKDLPELITLVKKILSPKPMFFLINGYASGYSSIAYKNNIYDLQKKFGGVLEAGELSIKESGENARLLPAGIFARWSR